VRQRSAENLGWIREERSSGRTLQVRIGGGEGRAKRYRKKLYMYSKGDWGENSSLKKGKEKRSARPDREKEKTGYSLKGPPPQRGWWTSERRSRENTTDWVLAPSPDATRKTPLGGRKILEEKGGMEGTAAERAGKIGLERTTGGGYHEELGEVYSRKKDRRGRFRATSGRESFKSLGEGGLVGLLDGALPSGRKEASLKN